MVFQGDSRNAETQLHATQLTHTKKIVVEKTDFSTEIRGRRDIEGFVASSEVLLDLHDTQLESIIDKLLDSMLLSDHKISNVSTKR